jgi:glutathione peroxidase-family protein
MRPDRCSSSVYETLRAWHAKYPQLSMLLWPSDEFGEQELPTEQIPGFVSQYLPVNDEHVHVMAKARVNGHDADPVWVTAKLGFPGDVEWNFDALFLIGEDGVPVGRYSADERELQRLDGDLAFLCTADTS